MSTWWLKDLQSVHTTEKHDEWEDVIHTNVQAHKVITLVLYQLFARSPAYKRVINASYRHGEVVYFDVSVQVRLKQLDMRDELGRFLRDVNFFCQWLYPNSRQHDQSCNAQIFDRTSKALLDELSRV